MPAHSAVQWVGYGSEAARGASRVDPLIRSAFYVFVFSLFLEQGQVLGLPAQIPTLVGCLLIMAACLQPSVCYRLSSGPFWWFLGYLGIFALSIVVHGDAYEHGEPAFKETVLAAQAFVIFWLASNLLTDRRIARGALIALATGAAVVALAVRLGLAETEKAPHPGLVEQRAAALGQNPNVFGGLLALGMLAMWSLTWGEQAWARRYRYPALALLGLVGWAIVATGSRSALPCLGLGVLVVAVGPGTKGSRVKNLLTGGILILALAGLAYFNEATRYRFELLLEQRNMAGREQIYPAAWQMFLERPVLGWGPVIKDFELERRVQHPGFQYRDTHNLYLAVLTSTGLIGALPFFVGLWLCGRSAWSACSRQQRVLPFALLVVVLAVNLTGDWVYYKMLWLILGYALASGRQDPSQALLPPASEGRGRAAAREALQEE